MFKDNTIRVLGVFLFVAVVALGTIVGCDDMDDMDDMMEGEPFDSDGIRLTMINNCPDTTLWARGENPPGEGSVGLPNNNQKIEEGGMWMTTLPGNWPSGRIWVCPFDTEGKNPWTTDGQEFSFGCTWIEPSAGINAIGGNKIKLC